MTARYLAGLPVEAVADDVRAAGVPDALAAQFWTVVRENIETLADLPGWWQVFAGGVTADPAPEDADFVAEALTLLGDPPYGPETWANWTAAAKDASGRKGRALFAPLRQAVTGRSRGPEMADVMPLLQVKPKRG